MSEWKPIVREITVTPAMVKAGLGELLDHGFEEEFSYIAECVYRAMAYEEPSIDDDGDLAHAVSRFKAALPGWWFTVGRCGLTCHASVGPDRAFVAEPLLSKYDSGFHSDIPNPSTCAAALDEATRKAVAAQRDSSSNTDAANGGSDG